MFCQVGNLASLLNVECFCADTRISAISSEIVTHPPQSRAGSGFSPGISPVRTKYAAVELGVMEFSTDRNAIVLTELSPNLLTNATLPQRNTLINVR
jgi:hypothetical protein